MDENLSARSAALGDYALEYLRGIRSRHVVEVRGKGLWIGIELNGSARPFCEALKQRGVLCKETHTSVIRLAPPLIIDKADVVIQNLRPGHVEKLGLDGPGLLQLKPSLIYCNLGAFGATGPLKDRPGYDPLMQAFGGIMSTTGEPGRPSVRVGASIVDMGTGMWAVIGLLAALHERHASGKGRVVDVSLFETATCWVSLLAAQYLASGQLAGKQGSGAPGIAPYKAYATSDGEIVVAAGSDVLFRSLADALGRPEWQTDPRFTSNPDRVTTYLMPASIFPLWRGV